MLRFIGRWRRQLDHPCCGRWPAHVAWTIGRRGREGRRWRGVVAPGWSRSGREGAGTHRSVGGCRSLAAQQLRRAGRDAPWQARGAMEAFASADVRLADRFPLGPWNHDPARVPASENAHFRSSRPGSPPSRCRTRRQGRAVLVRVAHCRNRAICGIEGSVWFRSGTVPSEFIGQSLAVWLNE